MLKKLSESDIQQGLATLDRNWSLNKSIPSIERTFNFTNYYECLAFVNAVGWIAHQQDHHPDMLVKYNTCRIVFSTHSAAGITELDFSAAQEVDRLSKLC